MLVVHFGIITLLALTTGKVMSFAEDTGCAPYGDGAAGESHACACNSSYCDVTAPPSRLMPRRYHHYSTSRARPGFLRAEGAFASTVVGPPIHQEAYIKVNTSTQYQEILGFGGAITDTAAAMFNSLPPEAKENFIQSYFGPYGIEYSFARVPIGSTDFSFRKYSLNDVPYDVNMKHFNLTEESFIYQIPLIKKAQAASGRGVRLLASTWSVPGWMKQNWNGDNDEGWLDPSSYDALSDYLVKFIEAYKAEGLDVWGVTGGNEVIVFSIIPMAILPKSMRLNGTMMSADAQRDWVKRLKPRIGSDVKFITMDDCRSFLDYWMRRIEMDEEALEAVDGVALHWYYDWISSPTALDEFHKRYPNKLILYTESSINTLFGDPRPVVLGSWERAEYYIHNIMENLNHWTQAYMDWNLALDPNGGPFMAVALDAAVIINATSGEFYKQPIFYAIGHFSKFISPGSKRVWTSWNQQITRNRCSNKRWTQESKAAVKSTKTPLGDLLTIPLPTEIECLATSGPDGRRTVFVFNPQNVSQDVRIEDSEIGTILTTVEENSINSFVYWSS